MFIYHLRGANFNEMTPLYAILLLHVYVLSRQNLRRHFKTGLRMVTFGYCTLASSSCLSHLFFSNLLFLLTVTFFLLSQKQTSQLDFLLDKASQYSSFIARDLQELQESLTDTARMKLEKAAKKDKKRKSKGGKESSGKKSKKNDGGAALKSAQEKHATIVAGTKPIFIQPPNLADGCVLKDYQLEGVRWLVSLFENGVSGILADEVRSYARHSVIIIVGSNVALAHRWDSARLFKSLL